MRTKNIKIKITMDIPFDRPDKNGVIYTRAAVAKAVASLDTKIPIIVEDCILWVTNENSVIEKFNDESVVCEVTIDGIMSYGGIN